MTYEEVEKLTQGKELKPLHWFHVIDSEEGPFLSTETPTASRARLCSFMTDADGKIKRWERVGDWHSIKSA